MHCFIVLAFLMFCDKFDTYKLIINFSEAFDLGNVLVMPSNPLAGVLFDDFQHQ